MVVFMPSKQSFWRFRKVPFFPQKGQISCHNLQDQKKKKKMHEAIWVKGQGEMYTLTSEIKNQCSGKRLKSSYQIKSKNQNKVHYHEILKSIQKNCWKCDSTTKFQRPKNFNQEKQTDLHSKKCKFSQTQSNPKQVYLETKNSNKQIFMICENAQSSNMMKPTLSRMRHFIK